MKVVHRFLYLAVLIFSMPLAEHPARAEGGADPDPADHLVAEAFTAMQAGRHEEAERIFFQALQIDRQHKQGRFGLGTLYIKMDRYERAVRLLEGLNEDFPGEYFVLNNLAWLFATAPDLKVRDGARAVKLAQEALLLRPDAYHVWSTLSEGHYVNGDYRRSLRAAREALRLSRLAGIPEADQLQYQNQITRAQRAAEALSILD